MTAGKYSCMCACAACCEASSCRAHIHTYVCVCVCVCECVCVCVLCVCVCKYWQAICLAASCEGAAAGLMPRALSRTYKTCAMRTYGHRLYDFFCCSGFYVCLVFFHSYRHWKLPVPIYQSLKRLIKALTERLQSFNYLNS